MSSVSRDKAKSDNAGAGEAAARASGQFLAWLFGPQWQEVSLTAAVSGGSGWYGGPWAETRAAILSDPAQDLYYSVGCFPAGDVTPRRKDRVTGVAGLVLDDVGTKGAGSLLSDLDDWGVVGAKIETSAGNFHWVLKYNRVLTSRRTMDLHVLTVNALAKLGVADRLGDVTRFMRLPAGVNSKPGRGMFPVSLAGGLTESASVEQAGLTALVLEYLGENSLACEIDQTSGDVDGWPDDLASRVTSALKQHTGTRSSELSGGVSGAGAGGGGSPGSWGLAADLADPDPWLRLQVDLAERAGWAPPEAGSGDGTVDCRCPFGDEHSSDELIRYLGNGHWKCHHSSCADRTLDDYKRGLLGAWDAVRGDDPPGGVLIARWMFDRAGTPALAGLDGGLAPGGMSDALADQLLALGDQVRAGGAGVAPISAEEAEPLLSRYVLVSQGQRGQPGWWDTKGRVLLSGAQLEAQEDVLAVYPAGKSGAKAARHQMANLKGLRVVSMLGHEPGVSGVYTCQHSGQKKISIWEGSDVKPLAGTPELFLEHMDWLVGPKGTAARDELECFMAWLVRNPDKKAPRTIIMVGAQGVGKDIVVDMMARLLGPHNVEHIDAEDLASGYNGWQKARLVCLPEMDAGQRYSIVNRLKRLSGSGGGWVMINEKYLPPYRARDVSHYWMTTNDLGSLPIDADSRRDLVVACPEDAHPGGEAYYQRVGASLTGVDLSGGAGGADPDEIRRVLWYLSEAVDLSGYNPARPAPLTAAKTMMAMASHSDSVQELLGALEELGFSEHGLAGVTGAVVGSRGLAKALEFRAGLKGVSGKGRALGRAMSAMGWVTAGDRFRDSQGGLTRPWIAKSDRLEYSGLDHQTKKARLAQADAVLMGKPALASAAG